MQPSPGASRFIQLTILLLLCLLPCGKAAEPRRYQLLEGSNFLDDCAVCDRLSLPLPLRGEFYLNLVSENSLFSRYSLTNIHFTARIPGSEFGWELRGSGEVEIGGEVALLQRWVLNLTVTGQNFTNSILLTNKTLTLDRPVPNLSVSCNQSNGTLTSTIYLDLKAAPVEEIWFLARKPIGAFEAGDIVSSRGRLVKSQAELLNVIGISNRPPEVMLDAVDIRAGYRFSLSGPVQASSRGPISDGDFIAGNSQLLSANQWKAAFGIRSDTPDPGLDAAHFLDAGDTAPVDLLFSIRQPFFSSKLNRWLGRGDLLALSYGSLAPDVSVRRTNAQLLSRFQPPNSAHDYGLDGVYVWAHGEIWFSVEEGFNDARFGAISEGDLLSDAGYVVFRNSDLVLAFGDSMDVGLSDFFVVTGAGYSGTAPILNLPQLDRGNGDVTLSWRSSLASPAVVQWQRASHVGAPFEPVSPVITEMQWIDRAVLKSNRTAIYKLRAL